MAPAFLMNIDGLETNAINQLLVRQTLQTTRDDDIFAIGDCAACPWPERSGTVPPRTSRHQQATHLYKQLQRRGRPTIEPWHYRDFGSLVSFGEYSTVGSLMGKLIGRSLFVEGYFARFMYVSLYRIWRTSCTASSRSRSIRSPASSRGASSRMSNCIRPRL